MIEMRDVCKAYRTTNGWRVILDHVSIRFPQNAHVGILGRNGAGKSTILRMIGGIEQPDYGTIVRRAKVSWPMGFSAGFHGDLSGRENMRFIARIYGQDQRKVTKFVDDFAELGEYLDMPVRTYSSGMRAKLAFGISLAFDFDIYLVDEITAVGDRWFRDRCEAAFQERRRRSGIIMVSHSPGTIRAYCTQCAILSGGRMTLFDTVDDALSIYNNLPA